MLTFVPHLCTDCFICVACCAVDQHGYISGHHGYWSLYAYQSSLRHCSKRESTKCNGEYHISCGTLHGITLRLSAASVPTLPWLLITLSLSVISGTLTLDTMVTGHFMLISQHLYTDSEYHGYWLLYAYQSAVVHWLQASPDKTLKCNMWKHNKK